MDKAASRTGSSSSSQGDKSGSPSSKKRNTKDQRKEKEHPKDKKKYSSKSKKKEKEPLKDEDEEVKDIESAEMNGKEDGDEEVKGEGEEGEEGEEGTSEGGLNPFGVLPSELCLKVLRFLPPRYLPIASAVSSQWKQLCEDESLWKWHCLEISPTEAGRQLVTTFVEHHPQITWRRLYIDYQRFFTDTELLDPGHKAILASWLGKEQTWKLQYRASVHGFGARPFHKRCDDKGATVTVARSEDGYLFGGYNGRSWAPWDDPQSGGSKPEAKSAPFIFSLTNPWEGVGPMRLMHRSGLEATTCNINFGPVWGGAQGSDLKIFGYPTGSSKFAKSALGTVYEVPPASSLYSPSTFLAGKDHFPIVEVEVFVVNERMGPPSALSDSGAKPKKSLWSRFIKRSASQK